MPDVCQIAAMHICDVLPLQLFSLYVSLLQRPERDSSTTHLRSDVKVWQSPLSRLKVLQMRQDLRRTMRFSRIQREKVLIRNPDYAHPSRQTGFQAL